MARARRPQIERPRRFLSVDLRRRFGGAEDGTRAYERFVLDGLPRD